VTRQYAKRYVAGLTFSQFIGILHQRDRILDERRRLAVLVEKLFESAEPIYHSENQKYVVGYKVKVHPYKKLKEYHAEITKPRDPV
jgi:hypothetical protein